MSRLVVSLFSILALASCTGSLPTSGALPALDGQHVTGVSAAKVGDYTADQVASGTKSVMDATDTGSGSTLVKRDASGNFSAGTVTANIVGDVTGNVSGSAATAAVANYAMGQQGSDLNSAATLTLTNDGNYFLVKGTTNIGAISTRAAGQKVQLLFNGTGGADTAQLTLLNSGNLKLSGGGNFIVYPGDYFEFVSEGTTWREVARSAHHDSYLYAFQSVSDQIGSQSKVPNETVLHFDVKVNDYQKEYNAASGLFTPNQNGQYQITVNTWIFYTWSANDWCRIIVRNLSRPLPGGMGVESLLQQTNMPGGVASFCSIAVNGTFRATAGNTIQPVAQVSVSPEPAGGTFVPTSVILGFTYMTITRFRE